MSDDSVTITISREAAEEFADVYSQLVCMPFLGHILESVLAAMEAEG